jgi:MFS family permease
MAAVDESSWRYRGWLVVAVCLVVIAVASGARFAFGVLLDPLVEAFDATLTAVSLTQSVQLIAYAVSQPVMGHLIDRYGPRGVFVASIVAMTVGLVASAFAPSLLWFYATHGVLIGVGYGGVGALAIAAILAPWFEERRGFAISVANSGFNLGQLAVAPLLGLALTVADWEVGVVAIGVAMFATLLPTVAVLGSGGSREEARPDAAEGFEGSLDVDTFREAVVTRSYGGINVSYFICGFTDFVVLVHLVSFLRDVGYSLPVASTALGLIGAASFVGVIVGGWVADRIRTKDTLAGFYAIRIVGYLVLLQVGRLGALDDVAVYAFVALFGVTLYVTAPLTSTLTADLYGDALMGSSYGWASAVHQVGAAIGAAFAAYVFDTTGAYRLAFLACAGLLVVGTAAVYVVREPRQSAGA